jgi:iron complex outermembrane recepter protein
MDRSAFSPFMGLAVLVCVASLGWPSGAARTDEPAPSGANASEAQPEKPLRSELVEKVVVSGSVARDRRDPVPFTHVTRDELAERNRGQDTAMLLADTPNAYAYSDAGNGVGYSYLSLRGFDQRRIAVQINGVPLNTPETHQVYFVDLADLAGSLDSFQVQRGPGLSEYGSPAVGGLVNMEFGHLSPTPGGEVKLGAGSFGTRRASIRYGGGLGDGTWAWMVRAARVTSDGYRIPSWTRHTFGHLALQRFGENSVLRIHVFGGPEKTQLAYYGVPASWLRGELTGDADSDRRINPLAPGETDTYLQRHAQGIHDLRVAENLFLKNTLFGVFGAGYFRQYSSQLDYDPLGEAPPTPEFPELTVDEAWRKRRIDERQLGWIPRVEWNHRGGTLTGGLETRFHAGLHRGTLEEGEVGGALLTSPLQLYDYTNRKSSVGAFVRETWLPTPKVAVHAELRGVRHELRMRKDRVRDLSFDASYSTLVPKAGLNWNVDDRWNLYASVSTARSEPTFRDIWDPQDPFTQPSSLFARFDPARGRYADPEARPERLRAWEAGGAYRHGAVHLKVSLYRMGFQDELVFAGGIDDDGIPITDNAGRSVHQGIELEGTARLPGEVDVSGYLAVSRDELKEYVLVFGPDPEDRLDYSGNRIALFPDHLARLRVAKRFGPVRLVLGARRVGTIYLDNSQDERKDPDARQVPGYEPKKIDPYTLVDLQAIADLSALLGGRGTSLSLDLQVDNLLDKRYAAFGYAFGPPEFIPGASRGVHVGLTYGF